jgi:hypothetical protein
MKETFHRKLLQTLVKYLPHEKGMFETRFLQMKLLTILAWIGKEPTDVTQRQHTCVLT